MKIDPKIERGIRDLVEMLGRCSLWAADPHCDCRTDIARIIDQCNEVLDDMFADDVAGEHVEVVPADLLARKGGGD